MNVSTQPRLKVFSGGGVTYTCGVCGVQINPDETYAGVLYELSRRPDSPGWRDNPGVTREVRHLGDCAEWAASLGDDILPSDLLRSHRVLRTEWGPRYTARVISVDRADVNRNGWFAVWVCEADDPSCYQTKVYIPGEELVHLKKAA